MQRATSFGQAMLRKYPEAIAVVVVRDRKGNFNPMPLGWIMTASREPPMLAFAVGLTRYTLREIRQTREFVIAFPPSTMGQEILYYGTNSGRDVDKLAETPVRTEPASTVNGVLMSDAVANFECRLVSELPTGDHVIFVGQVLASHVNQEESVRRLYSIAQGESGGVVPG